jgi:DNA-binding NtrC family response regulator
LFDDKGKEAGEGHESDAEVKSFTLRGIVCQAIKQTLEATDWNKSKAAERLGVTRQTLDNHIKRYRIEESGKK